MFVDFVRGNFINLVHGAGFYFKFTNHPNQHGKYNTQAEINNNLPALRPSTGGNHAHRCLSVFLRMHQLPQTAETSRWRLLHILQLRNGEMPAHATGYLPLLIRKRRITISRIYLPRFFPGINHLITNFPDFVPIHPLAVFAALILLSNYQTPL